MSLLQLLAIIILSITPALAWGYFLLAKSDESRPLMVKAFFWGGVATVPLLIYRFLWNIFPSFNFTKTVGEAAADKVINLGHAITIPLSYIIIFMTIGILEEYLKSFVVRKKIPHKEINCIGDAVEFSVIAALGFAFVENIFYLGEVYTLLGSGALIKMFIARALFATFAHMLFSGIFGYYYGLSLFADQNLKTAKKKWDLRLINYLGNKFPILNKLKIVQVEETFLGLIYAASFHAIYNIFLELKFTIFLIPFLVFGCVYLHRLLHLKSRTAE